MWFFAVADIVLLWLYGCGRYGRTLAQSGHSIKVSKKAGLHQLLPLMHTLLLF